MGDIGKPVKHIELVPLTTPAEQPVTVPDREPVPA